MNKLSKKLLQYFHRCCSSIPIPLRDGRTDSRTPLLHVADLNILLTDYGTVGLEIGSILQGTGEVSGNHLSIETDIMKARPQSILSLYNYYTLHWGVERAFALTVHVILIIAFKCAQCSSKVQVSDKIFRRNTKQA